MSALDFLLPWNSQPQETVDVDRDNPLASGLLIAILPQFPVNLADGVALSAYGTRVVSGGVRGMMNTSGGMLLPAPVNASDPSAKYDLSSGTALVVAVQSTETNDGIVFTRGKGSSSALWAIGLHGGSHDGAVGSWGNSGSLGASSGGPVPTIPRVATITADGATARAYIDGVELQSGAYTPGAPEYDTANLRQVLFGLNRTGNNTNTNTFLAALWDRPLSAAEVRSVSANPWQLFAPRSIWVPVSAGGGGPTYTLTSDAGSYALTGSAAGLKASRNITAGAGSFALTGASAGLTAQRKLTASAGAYALTGADASLTYTPVGTAYSLSAEAGSFTLTGNAAALTAQRKIAAEAGSFALTGADATLTYTQRVLTLIAGAGSFALSGGDATLTYSGFTPSVGKRFKRYGKAYLRRENEVFVFPSEEAKDEFLGAEEQAAQAINRKARRAVIAAQPKPEKINLARLAQDAERMRLESVAALVAKQDYERVIAIQRMIEDEEDNLMMMI